MRILFCLLIVLITTSGCKKKIESIQQDLLIKVIVDGQWQVTKYIKGNTDQTASFAAYSFQFKKDLTVDALKNNILEKTGSWNGNIDTRTITSNFPDAAPPLSLLNGSWYITDSDLTYVESTQNVNGEERFLRLDKK